MWNGGPKMDLWVRKIMLISITRMCYWMWNNWINITNLDDDDGLGVLIFG